MENREAVRKFFVETQESKVQSPKSKGRTTDHGQRTTDKQKHSRVSQIVSLTGFSFVGGPAMNDSEAAAEFLCELNVPYRSAVSLDTHTIEAWRDSQTGLNPIQAGGESAISQIERGNQPFL